MPAESRLRLTNLLFLGILSCCAVATGCSPFKQYSVHHYGGYPRHLSSQTPISPEAPKELHKLVLPTYRVEPPDILSIDAVSLVPRSPYFLKPTDVLFISIFNALSEIEIEGEFPIQTDGNVDLGIIGTVEVGGLSLAETKAQILMLAQETLADPTVSVTIRHFATQQQIAGEHLVTPDGTMTLGSYGSLSVVGMTLAEIKSALEKHLSEYFHEPEISVAVFAYNSKSYYVIMQGAGQGDQLLRFPVTGNETVIDALSQVQGLTPASSTHIWIARPSSEADACDLILPVDWYAMTQRGKIDTNYQVLPGDRIYVAEDKLVALDSFVAKWTAPFERVFGFSLLGSATVSRLSGPVLKGGGMRFQRGLGGF